ncbi:MAG: DUF3108 domain-containing protein [Gammaproteobacteria bacterium]
MTMPRTVCAAIISAALSLAPSAANAQTVEPFVVTYDVNYSGTKVAETTLSLSINNDTGLHELSSVTEPRGLAALIRYGDVVEVSHFNEKGARYAPVDYRFNDGTRKGKRNSSIFFDWAENSAQSTYKSVEASHTLIGNETDRLLLQLQIMSDMSRDALADAYRVIDRNEIKQYDFEILGDDVLSTQAGQFDTVKLRRQRPGSSRATLIWAAREHHFVPVKMIQTVNEKPNVVLSITALNEAE